MGAHGSAGGACWCGQIHPLSHRCLKSFPNCNCDGSPLTIGGQLPDRCDHEHGG